MSHLQGTNPYSKGKRCPGSCLYSKHIARITVSHQRQYQSRSEGQRASCARSSDDTPVASFPFLCSFRKCPPPPKKQNMAKEAFLGLPDVKAGAEEIGTGRGLQGKEQQGLEALPAVSRWHLLATPSSWEAEPCFCQAGAFALALRLDSEQLNKVIARVSLWATFCCFLRPGKAAVLIGSRPSPGPALP